MMTVTSSGQLELDAYDAAIDMAGLNLSRVLASFDLAFTGSFSSMSIQYSYTGLVTTSLVRVFHWNGSTWVSLTPTVDTNARTITFNVPSLSPFIIGTLPGTTAPGFDIIRFLTENWIILIIGVGAVVVVVGAVAARRKTSSKVKAKIPPKSKKGSMEYKEMPPGGSKDVSPARGKQPADLPTWVQSASDEKKVAVETPPADAQGPRFYCQSCLQYYNLPESKPGDRYSCPSCNKELARVANCPLCGKSFAMSQESFDSQSGKEMECPSCHKKFMLSSKPELHVGDNINLYCPTCQAWAPRPAVKRVLGQEQCQQCGALYFVVTQCSNCKAECVIPVDQFNEFRANPSRCGKCDGIFKVL
jgi:hypothetical protein